MLPKRIPKKANRTERFKSQSHMNFVRKHACCACGSMVHIQVAHVRMGTDGGLGRKPSDFWTISLCRDCHDWQHRNSEQALEQKHGIDMKALAREFVRASPKRLELEAARDGV